MWSYILKRLLLMIPTLLGVLLITFVVIQFVPGGPVEQMVAQLQGRDSAAGEIGAGGGAAASAAGGYRGTVYGNVFRTSGGRRAGSNPESAKSTTRLTRAASSPRFSTAAP